MRFVVLGTLSLGTGCVEDVGTFEEEEEAEPQDNSDVPVERYLYIATIANDGGQNPDFIAVVGVDRKRDDYGKIIFRADMPNIGDEIHHFGYSADQQRLIVPGLMSGRINIFDVSDTKKPKHLVTNNSLVPSSGYIAPHSVVAMPQQNLVLVTMLGAASQTTLPGGMVMLNDRTGDFVTYYGPGPNRAPTDLGPKYMYDYDTEPTRNRGISTTFGSLASCTAGLNPACFGDEVAVWDVAQKKVVQTANLGPASGAIEVKFIHPTGRALINTTGSSAVWVAEDDDRNGVYAFHQVLGPADGLFGPADLLLSYDKRFMYLTNWLGSTVQQWDIADPFHPVLLDEQPVPHANMMRLSKDGKRLYVTNSLISVNDNDPSFGPPRNNAYGLYVYDVNTVSGGLTSRKADGSALVSFENVQKKFSRGPAGPHMMFFDPSIKLAPGEH